uniref:Uncharacterized protein n=1 Tax=Anopheles epiroticus TaxID=199890 RepID=A0A182PU95_9DIPT
MMIGMFCGPAKPACLEVFLRPLVEEVKEIRRRGLQIGEMVLQIKIRAIIADAPARAFIKEPMQDSDGGNVRNIINYGGLHWRNCRILTWSKMYRRVIAYIYAILGLSFSTKQWISEFLINVQLPSEIPRQLRGLNVVRFWKGSEFRSYLHYVSPVLMEEFLNEKAYCHFLLYFCAMTIFSSSFHKRLWGRAAEFLNIFVQQYGEIYGREHLSTYKTICSVGLSVWYTSSSTRGRTICT